VFQGVPRALIAFGVVTIAALEIVTRLPDIVLLPQKIEAALGEYGAKAMQPKVVTTQVEKTEADTRLADTQAQLNAVQQDKTAAETRVAQMQAQVTAAMVAKTQADTQLAQMQTTLAATQAQKTQADAQLARAQTAKTNIETAQQGIGLAVTAGILGLGAKFISTMAGGDGGTQQTSTTQTTTQAALSQPTSSFEVGRADWHKWSDWERSLDGDTLAGVRFWADVRSHQPPPSCSSDHGAYSADFRDGCETAKKFLTGVDKARLSDADYRQGWNAGAKETGDL
jgi:multidrug efflux pump subunit AcrA (membrane-fusion protein)